MRGGTLSCRMWVLKEQVNSVRLQSVMTGPFLLAVLVASLVRGEAAAGICGVEDDTVAGVFYRQCSRATWTGDPNTSPKPVYCSPRYELQASCNETHGIVFITVGHGTMNLMSSCNTTTGERIYNVTSVGYNETIVSFILNEGYSDCIFSACYYTLDDNKIYYVNSSSCNPVLETTEPVLETTEPVLETTEPVLETTEPVLETTEPVLETTEPVLETTEPVLETTEPVLETTELPLPTESRTSLAPTISTIHNRSLPSLKKILISISIGIILCIIIVLMVSLVPMMCSMLARRERQKKQSIKNGKLLLQNTDMPVTIMEPIQFSMKFTVSSSEESLCQSFYDKQLRRLEMDKNGSNNFRDYYKQDSGQTKFIIAPKTFSDDDGCFNRNNNTKNKESFTYDDQPASISTLCHHFLSEPYNNNEVDDSGYVDTTGKLDSSCFCDENKQCLDFSENFIVDEKMESINNLNYNLGRLPAEDSSVPIVTEMESWQVSCDVGGNVAHATLYPSDMKINTDGYIESSKNDSKRTGSSCNHWKPHSDEEFDLPTPDGSILCLDRDSQSCNSSFVPYLDDEQESNSGYLFDPSKTNNFQLVHDPEYHAY